MKASLQAVTSLEIRRGDVFYADLNPVIGLNKEGCALYWWSKMMLVTTTAQLQ